jgi:integrase
MRARLAGCADCWCWGWLTRGAYCGACYDYRRYDAVGSCCGCGRVVGIRQGACRLCRAQAAQQLGQARIRGPLPAGLVMTAWQVFLHDVPQPRLPLRQQDRTTPLRPASQRVCGQLPLFAIEERDYSRFDPARHADPSNPTLVVARAQAQRMAELNGWSTYLVEEVDLALLILLSDHADGDRIRYSQMLPIDKRGANVCRTAEVLNTLGLLDDDRADGFARWLEQRLTDLAPGIAVDVQCWADTLRSGDPRSKRRDEGTLRNYLRAAHPHLVAWSARYDHLREVTREDIRAVADAFKGLDRKRTLVALRSLFGFAKKRGRIFRNPTAGIRPGNPDAPMPTPLRPEQLRRAVAVAVTPAGRVVLALAAIHAGRPNAIAALKLDDVDVPNRRLRLGGITRILDDTTRHVIEAYLAERSERWPHTANPHLLITQRTAHDKRAVSPYWMRARLRGLGATLNQIRIDRQLEEALAVGPDPLHLAVVFGISESTAVRYAAAVRQLLELPPPLA